MSYPVRLGCRGTHRLVRPRIARGVPPARASRKVGPQGAAKKLGESASAVATAAFRETECAANGHPAAATGRAGFVPNVEWNRDNRQRNVNANSPSNENSNVAVRAGADDQARERSQPPSMRPASAAFSCSLKTLVSLASFISRRRRRHRRTTSSRPVARRR